MIDRVLLWGRGNFYCKYISLVKEKERQGFFHAIGVTSNDASFPNDAEDVRFIPKNEVEEIEFDFVIIMADTENASIIREEAIGRGIDEEIIFDYSILSNMKCHMRNHIRFLKHTPTIFANNCWGGHVYHNLGLQFRTPLINMWEKDGDYLKLLNSPTYYMEQEFTIEKMQWTETFKHYFPVCKCDDILLYCNHYTVFNHARDCWERRKKRINWDDLFVMMYTEDERVASEFSKLPYKKKICFVPFPTQLESVLYMDLVEKPEYKDYEFYQIVNWCASGRIKYYQVDELLASGQCVFYD